MTRRVHHLTNTRKQMPDKYCSCSIYSSSPPPTTRNPPMADYNATATPTPADTPATRRRPRLQRRHRRARAAGRALHRFSIRTVRLLIFLFNDPAASSPSRMGTSMTPTIPQSILLLSFHASTGRIGLGIQIPKIRIQIDTHCSK